MGRDGDHGEDAPRPADGSLDDKLEGPEFELLRRRVVSAVRRHCPPRLAGEAEDIAQNVLLKLLKSVRKSAGKKSFSSVYLEKSACGAVVDEIRRACRRRETPVEDPDGMDAMASKRAGPERGSSSREIAHGVLDCLKRLSRSRRLVVTLYLHGCTVPETAARRGWTLWKTESLVYRGMADMRRCLERKGLTP
jgi:RNA polymerase sigma-70 factor (ECF subfamily)